LKAKSKKSFSAGLDWTRCSKTYFFLLFFKIYGIDAFPVLPCLIRRKWPD